MEPHQTPENFSDLQLMKPMKGKWMHIIAFTTETNYKDIHADTRLLKAAENLARELRSSVFCVPLSKNHPYPAAFNFFEGNGYQKVGTIQWLANSNEKIDCYFYSKSV